MTGAATAVRFLPGQRHQNQVEGSRPRGTSYLDQPFDRYQHLTPIYQKRCHRSMTIDTGERWAAQASAPDECVEGDASAAVFLFRSLADPARLRILRHLTLGDHRVVDLTVHLGLAQSTTSAHLACLRDRGLVSSRTVGRASVYSLAAGKELMGLLAAAERLLAVTGDANTLRPDNHSDPAEPVPATQGPRSRPRRGGMAGDA